MVLREEHALTRAILALISLLYTPSAVTEDVILAWWQPYEFGRCTKTDIQELGGCGLLVIEKRPNWNRK